MPCLLLLPLLPYARAAGAFPGHQLTFFSKKTVRFVGVIEKMHIFSATSKGMAFLANVWRFYRDGFREMTWGRTLWIIILVKLFILFAVLRVFFFRPALAGLDAAEKPAAVADELLRQGGEGASAPGLDTLSIGQ